MTEPRHEYVTDRNGRRVALAPVDDPDWWTVDDDDRPPTWRAAGIGWDDPSDD